VFSERGPNFYTMFNRFEVCPKYFSWEDEKISKGEKRPPWLQA